MYAYGISIGFCEHLCKDAIHDVFYTIYQSNNDVGHIESIEFYLLKSMKNRLFDIYKEQKKISCTCYDNSIMDQDADSIGRIINEENQVLIKETVESLLQKLKPKQRKIVYCRFHHNLKFDDIGVVMGMSADAVKRVLYRSLKQLKQEQEFTPSKFL